MQHVSKVAFVSPTRQATSQPQDTSPGTAWRWGHSPRSPASRAGSRHAGQSQTHSALQNTGKLQRLHTVSTAHWKQNPQGLLSPEPGTCFPFPVCHAGAVAEHWHRGRTSSTNVFREVGAAGSNSAEISTRDLPHSKMFTLKAAASRPLSLESETQQRHRENEEGQEQGWERCRMSTS